MWKFCPECKEVTRVRPMSYNLYMYSFAMFLLMTFYEDSERMVRPRNNSGPSGSRSRSRSRSKSPRPPPAGSLPVLPCCHSLMQAHYTCFSSGDYVATFKHERLSLPALRLPPKRFSVPRPPPAAADSPHTMPDLINGLSTHGAIVFNALLEEISRLHRFSRSLEGLSLSVQSLEEEQKRDHEEFRELMNTLNARHQQQQQQLEIQRQKEEEEAIEATEDDDGTAGLEATVFNVKKHISDSLVRWRQHLEALQVT